MITIDKTKPLRLYQIFTGRARAASQVTHPKKVFSRMSNWDYSSLKENGFNCVYLLGVFDNQGPIIVTEEQGQSLDGKSLRLPSVFALSDHTKTNPELGTVAQLKKLVKHIQSFGLKVIVDFVPNHTSTAHPWVTKHPEYYVQQDGDFVREFSGDVYKLNYQQSELRSEMITVIETIASLGVDGIRCDMAHLVPVDFWHEAIKQVKQSRSRFIFMAEAYTDSVFNLEPLVSLIDAGFEYIYHEPLYRNCKFIWQDHQPLSHMIDHLNFALNDFPITKMVHYLSNHDDSFIPETIAYREALLTLLYFLPGSVLIANGSLHNRFSRLAHHYYDELPDQDNEVLAFPKQWQKLLSISQTIQERVNRLELSDEGLVTANLGEHYKLVCNLSPRTLFLPKHKKALLHSQSNAGLIQSGLAEILEV